MEEDPYPHNVKKSLTLSFDTSEKQNDFICELLLIPLKEAHFSLEVTKKNCCILCLFASSPASCTEGENKIMELAENTQQHEKNIWWKW